MISGFLNQEVAWLVLSIKLMLVTADHSDLGAVVYTCALRGGTTHTQGVCSISFKLHPSLQSRGHRFHFHFKNKKHYSKSLNTEIVAARIAPDLAKRNH